MTMLTVCIVTGLQAFMCSTPTAFVGTFIICFPLLLDAVKRLAKKLSGFSILLRTIVRRLIDLLQLL